VPVLEQRITLIIRSVRAFLNLQAGVTRGGTVPWPALADQDRQLAELQAQPTGNGAEASRQRQDGSPGLVDYGANGLGTQKSVRAEQLIWMFGHSRTGSTWLSWMMAELDNQERWHEPYVGMLFGFFMFQRLKNNEKLRNNPTFIMGEPYREVWLRSIKNFVLEGATVRYPDLREDQYLVVKEPNGSIGAPLLMEATPESRMIFLIRDPRDVVASRLEAFKQGGWTGRERDYSTARKLAKGEASHSSPKCASIRSVWP
jgi:hypothetical protein